MQDAHSYSIGGKMAGKRDRNPNFSKIKAVLDTLKQYPEGLWLSALSEESKIPRMTITRYIDGILRGFVENVGVKDEEGNFVGLRIIKLKHEYMNRDFSINNIKEMLEARKLIKSVGQ